MAKKRKQKRHIPRRPSAVEDHRAEIVTVAWMLATIATLGAEVIGGAMQAILNLVENTPKSLASVPNLMLFSAAVTGIVCLALTPLVYQFRRTPPPMAVTAFAVTVSVLPFAIGIVQSLR